MTQTYHAVLQYTILPCALCNGTGVRAGAVACDVCKGYGEVRTATPPHKCTHCNGTGFLAGEVICDVCKGCGAVRAPSPPRKCAHCGGSGVEPGIDRRCGVCYGTGWAYGRSANV